MEYRKGIMKVSLAENLRALMVKHLFEKITIKQICDETGVIRATFYNYFDDKYDCLNWIVWHDLAEEYIRDIDHINMQIYMEKITNVIVNNREFYRNAYNVTGQNSFEDMIRSNITSFLKEYFNHHRKKNYMEQYSDEVLAMYYAEGIAMAVRVLAKTPDSRADDIVRMTNDLMKNSFFDFIEQ